VRAPEAVHVIDRGHEGRGGHRADTGRGAQQPDTPIGGRQRLDAPIRVRQLLVHVTHHRQEGRDLGAEPARQGEVPYPRQEDLGPAAAHAVAVLPQERPDHLVDVDANMVHGWPLAFCGLDRVIVVGRLHATTLSEGSAASSHLRSRPR
jgi:hypothetical protein